MGSKQQQQHAHLTYGQMRAIDNATKQGATTKQLAKKYGVNETTINNVLTRKDGKTMPARKDDKTTPKTDPEPQPEAETGAEQPPEQPPQYDDGPPSWAPQYDA